MTAPHVDAPVNRDDANWAPPVDRLSATDVPGTRDDAVTGKRVTGPLQGFGQLWQKTFRVPLEGVDLTPQAVIATWKDQFSTFWPKGQRFYAPLSGIAPGEVALMEIAPVPGSPVTLSTGIMVLYADDESFTLMTPQGHMFAGWITFSARREGDDVVAQAQVLMRASDPIFELGLMMGGHRQEDVFWQRTLTRLATHLGHPHVDVATSVVCVDKKRQWRRWRNVWHSSAIRSTIYTVGAPVRLLARGRG
jgi:hypothetical protein